MDNKQRLQDLKDDCRSVGWDGYIPAIEALEAENAALKARGPGLSEWVPVNVRLPDKPCMVVVAFLRMGVLMQCRTAIYMDGGFTFPSSDQIVRDVQYWMPLNPPKNSEV
jgi:hypothetical protein